MKVFESFAFKDVIGETPPIDHEMTQKIESEVQSLIKNLANKSTKDLEEALAEQLKIKRELNRLSGAMALSQPKMHVFTEFLTKYIDKIESRLKC